jgi:hypothetical protein
MPSSEVCNETPCQKALSGAQNGRAWVKATISALLNVIITTKGVPEFKDANSRSRGKENARR